MHDQSSMSQKPGGQREMRGNWCYCPTGSGIGGGVLLVGLGLYFLVRETGWIDIDLPLWPLVLVFIGVAIIFRGRRRTRQDDWPGQSQ